MMPGDIGDARLVSYFLENIYQFITTGKGSLWHLPMLYPFPYVGAFSENLFGASPLYCVARCITSDQETAFQLWFLASYPLNFAGCYYALRKMGVSPIGATVGSVIFAFALPTSMRSGHPQLSYRFAVPLAVLGLLRFFESRDWSHLVVCLAWLVLQLYCSIYIGFFTGLLVIGIILAHMFSGAYNHKANLARCKTDLCNGWRRQTIGSRLLLLSAAISLGFGLVLLFYPYLQVTQHYSFVRSVGEIASMLPRPESYFLSDHSWLWKSNAESFHSLPMRHEHQMFFGVLPLLLAIFGCFATVRKDLRETRWLIIRASVVVVLLTINIGGISLWLIFCQLPLASAIRAMTRLDLVLLFPVAFLGGLGVDALLRSAGPLGLRLSLLVGVMLVLEAAAISFPCSEKAEWQRRVKTKESLLPMTVPSGAVLFFAQKHEPAYAEELDAMLVSQRKGFPTINGYTGNLPPDFSNNFGQDLSELARRALSWISFSSPADPEREYFDFIRRVIPVGFSDNMEIFEWSASIPARTRTRHVYSPEQLSKLTLSILGIRALAGEYMTVVDITNVGDSDIASISSTGNHLNVSWRFIDKTGQPVSGWDNRKTLPFDIPAGKSVQIQLPDNSLNTRCGESVEVSLVQEGKFWLHDYGFTPPRKVIDAKTMIRPFLQNRTNKQ